MTTPLIHYNEICSDRFTGRTLPTTAAKLSYPSATLPVFGGNGGKGAVGLVSATLPVFGGNGGKGAVGLVIEDASAEPAAKMAKDAISAEVRILTKPANIEGYLLSSK